jgi:hypothetical protein
MVWCFIRGWLKQKLFDVICTEVRMPGAQGIKSHVKFASGLHQRLSQFTYPLRHFHSSDAASDERDEERQ